MKKYQGFLLMLLVCLLALCGAALADTLEEDRQALRQAETFDAQLAILNKIATENVAELEMGGWENSYTIDAAPGIPEGLIPEDWDKLVYTEADTLPEAMRGHKFIALYCAGNYTPDFAGDILARMPADMRAASLEEAEYALIVRWHLVESGFQYVIHATSYHRFYSAYAVNLKTGEYVRFWVKVNHAQGSGLINELDGDLFSQQELWTNLRAYVYGELRQELADGSVLVFDITGENCYLKRAELAEGVTELVIPGEIGGHKVTEIAAECLKGNKTLRSVVLSQGLKRISERVFEYCSALESVTLPNTLEIIGEEAFYGCSRLQNITFPDSLRTLGKVSFLDAKSLESIVLPGTIETMEYGVFIRGERLARVVVGEGIKSLPDSLFRDCNNVACYFFPSSLTGGLDNYMIVQSAAIYAPEGSYALTWARENGYAHVACDTPADMPPVEYRVEGDFEFQFFNGEAAVSRYLGQAEEVVIPSSAGGCPVTRVYSLFAEPNKNLGISVFLPQTVRRIGYCFVLSGGVHIYIANPDTVFARSAIWCRHHEAKEITIHAPEGSAAQRYVTEINDEQVVFEPWDEGGDSGAGPEPDPSLAPDAGSISDALKLAAKG
ncbi:MAG: leucine-rich repeat domain-containing protein [Christensenellales bacterium]